MMMFDYKDWIKVYEKNIKKQHIEIIKNSIIGIPLINFIEDNPRWGGSALTLLWNIGKVAENLGISIKQKAFPKTAHRFSQRLREIEPSLEEVGYKVTRSKEEGIEEHININKIYELDALGGLKRKHTLDKHFEDGENEKTLDEHFEENENQTNDSHKDKVDNNIKTFKIDVKKTLQDKLKIVYNVISETQKLTGVAKAETVFKLLLDVHKIDRDEAENFISILKRDRIYEPRPSYYKTLP